MKSKSPIFYAGALGFAAIITIASFIAAPRIPRPVEQTAMAPRPAVESIEFRGNSTFILNGHVIGDYPWKVQSIIDVLDKPTRVEVEGMDSYYIWDDLGVFACAHRSASDEYIEGFEVDYIRDPAHLHPTSVFKGIVITEAATINAKTLAVDLPENEFIRPGILWHKEVGNTYYNATFSLRESLPIIGFHIVFARKGGTPIGENPGL